MTVISLRLNEKDLERLDELSTLERKDRSTAARELLKYGWEFLMLRHYKEGILSLEGLAKKLDLSVSEAIDLLTKLGIEPPMEPHGQSPWFPRDAHKGRTSRTRGPIHTRVEPVVLLVRDRCHSSG